MEDRIRRLSLRFMKLRTQFEGRVSFMRPGMDERGNGNGGMKERKERQKERRRRRSGERKGIAKGV